MSREPPGSPILGSLCEDGPVPLRVGIDLASVDSVAESVQEHGQHYLERVYTDAELRDCESEAGVLAERLAARFAAKEAAIKVLRPGAQDVLPWRSIEVLSTLSGAVALQLSGPAAALAAEAGIEDLQVSITHEGLHACAVVIAEIRGDCRQRDRDHEDTHQQDP
jgi:holo-[acyl-carrier protein] synthase